MWGREGRCEEKYCREEMLALATRGEGGGGAREELDSALELGGEIWKVEVLLLFLLSCSYIL